MKKQRKVKRHSKIKLHAWDNGVAFVLYEGIRQVWTKAKARKPSTCVACGKPIQPKMSVYRPVGNPMNRFERAHKTCIEPQYSTK